MRKKCFLVLIPAFLMFGCESKKVEPDVGRVENLVIETIEPNTTGKVTVYVDGIADFEYSGEINIKNDETNGEAIEIIVDSKEKTIK